MAALLALLTACAAPRSDFNRVAPPIRFGALRENAAWMQGFDPAWWRGIDRAYEAFDRSLDEAAVARWDGVLAELSRDLAANRSAGVRGARRDLALRREVNDLLAAREAGLFDGLEDALPAEAGPFIALVRSRTAFHRSAALLREGEPSVPGPLEVLGSCGVRALQPRELEAATLAYARLAPVAAEVSRARAQRFIELQGGLDGIDAEMDALPPAPGEGDESPEAVQIRADRARVEAARGALVSAWERDRLRGVETLRLALLREGSEFARALADQAARDDFLDQLDFALHEGIRVAPGIRAFTRIARAAIQRVSPGDAEALATLDRLLAQELARCDALRNELRSGSKSARKSAFESLKSVGDPIGEFVGARLAAHGGVWGVLARAGDVLEGARTAEDAADEVVAPKPADPGDPAEPGGFPAVRRGELQLLFGTSLDGEVLGALVVRVGLDDEQRRALRGLVERENERLTARGRASLDELERALRDFSEPKPEPGEARMRVDRLMAVLSRSIVAIRQADSAANDMVLSEVARLAGLEESDPRIAVARAELALLSELGTSSERMQRDEQITGLPRIAVANPFELARLAARSEAERDLAESIVLSRAEELLAAHRDAARALRATVRGFLLFILEASLANRTNLGRWDAPPLGAAATAVRIRLADELRSALGDAYGDRLLAAWAERSAPGFDPRRPDALLGLDRLAAGERIPEPERAVIVERLDQADERRREALSSAISWRGGWALFGTDELKSATEAARLAPRGWLLRARVADADDRALAACESVLAEVDRMEDELRSLRSVRAAPLMRLSPNFD